MEKWIKALEGISYSEWNDLQIVINNKFFEQSQKVTLKVEKIK